MAELKRAQRCAQVSRTAWRGPSKSGDERVTLRAPSPPPEGCWKVFSPWQIPLLSTKVTTQQMHWLYLPLVLKEQKHPWALPFRKMKLKERLPFHSLYYLGSFVCLLSPPGVSLTEHTAVH